MNYKISFVVISLIFYLRIHSVSCLKCHVCNTATKGQEDCQEIPEKMTKYLTECHGPKNATCRIQEQWVEFDMLTQPAERRVIRQCASTPMDLNRPCYYRAGYGGKTNVCNCLGDGCNEATRSASALFVIVGTFLFYKLIM